MCTKESKNKQGRIGKFEMKKGIIYRVCNNGDDKQESQIVVPKLLREHMMKLSHDSIMGGHLGINKTHERIKAIFYRPDMAGALGDTVSLIISVTRLFLKVE